MSAADHIGLGVDFGGVIAAMASADGTRLYRIHPRDVPPCPGAFEALRELRSVFGERVWVISKAASDTERWTLEWMRFHQFSKRTDIAFGNVEFVRERADKRTRCLIHGVTHFVDDRIENLESLALAVGYRFLFGERYDRLDSAEHPWVTLVRDWAEALPAMLESIASSPVDAPPEKAGEALTPDMRRYLEGCIFAALERDDSPEGHEDRVDAIYDLNHLFYGIPAAGKALLEVGGRTDDDPGVVSWCGFYLGELWLGLESFPHDQASRLSSIALKGVLARVGKERPEWGAAIRDLESESDCS